jgi:hypothetical protein
MRRKISAQHNWSCIGCFRDIIIKNDIVQNIIIILDLTVETRRVGCVQVLHQGEGNK